ncbi:MAG: hypothetical protein HY220_02520 [Candidatus Sungbacteria bacterium]|uniref:Carboxypeptidase regulatory-like domain-containing protein n=1 Tax=Candidatus Sungiibacteriota bacterium TaxID=2750080 RepID=A0A9D6QVL5_9BACT|nr:hypothetical protein [Candidatus Sungbacteria bacterium]
MPFRFCLKNGARVSGFSLIEVVVGVGVFLIISVGVYSVYKGILNANRLTRARIEAISLANEEIELARNLPYAEVGTIGGIPSGVISQSQSTTRDGIPFTITTTIRSIDDPFDGTIGGNPNDTAPADYKLVEIAIACTACSSSFQPVIFTTTVAPKNLEGASTNGALFIRAFDAAGLAIPEANVHIQNNLITPNISIDDTTNNQGLLQLIDVPPSINGYQITVTKSGYSTDKTYPPGGNGTTTAVLPHATVAQQTVTQTSFAVDRVGSLDAATVNNVCNGIADISYVVSGSKLVGTNPNVLKYRTALATDSNGNQHVANLEWDSYNAAIAASGYTLAGSIPILPLNLSPNTNQSLTFVLAAKPAESILVTVRDAATLLPLTGAEVNLSGGSYNQTQTTGQGFFNQTDWSGGPGQTLFADPSAYFFDDGNIDANSPAGDVILKQVFGQYVASGYLESSTIDFGTSINYGTIAWAPASEPPQTGPSSVRFQIATSNDAATTTWNFLGPDGTAGTYYVASGTNINAIHNLNRYLRYRMYLQTANASYTPDVADVSITFNTGCIPPGQVFFSGMNSGSYTLQVSKSGYSTSTTPVSISGNATQIIDLGP